MTIESQLPAGLQTPVAERLQAAASEQVVRRIWERDGTLWAPEGTPEVTDRLGWLDIAERLSAEAEDLAAFGAEVRDAGITDAVLLGMGGSSLGPEVLRRSYGDGAIRLHVLDSTHPDEIRAVRDSLDLSKTVFIVSSKSGGTIETMSQFKYFHSLQGDGAHFVAVTDPGTSLAQLGAEHGFRRVFENDPDIGGRYSVLSYFGLVPAAIAGYDVGAVLATAREAMEACRGEDGNPGLDLGVALGELALQGRDKLTFIVDDPLASFGLWAEQLVAESTGKEGRGILPIADEPFLPAAEYGPDRVFVHVSTGDVEVTGKVGELSAAGHPVFTLDAAGPDDLGRVFFVSEFATAVAGWVLGINPFDQPNVQEAKDNTKRVLDEGSPELDPGDAEALIGALEPPRYLAIMGYLPYSDAVESGAARFRERVVRRHHVATTFGYGPRFLHSTGQFHKGGPAVGAFLQIVDEPQEDLEVPGEPYTFGTLIRAQADGDLQTLRSHGLDAVRAGREIL
jgi:glucose-6-phosphate isomerase/transaldolase/glucose-6-phosphate isomerase